MKKLLVVSITTMMATGLAFGAFAKGNSAKAEVSTAHAHAMMAESANSVSMSHTHLHHVINCLVGPDGKGFDTKAADPCKGQGNGAIPDSAGNAALGRKLKHALADAKSGLKSNKLSTVHKDAAKAASALQATSSQKASGGYSW
jgi:hypothetical protein